MIHIKMEGDFHESRWRPLRQGWWGMLGQSMNGWQPGTFFICMIWIILNILTRCRAKGRLIVWGHSLGTAVSSHLVTINHQSFSQFSQTDNFQLPKPTHGWDAERLWRMMIVLSEVANLCQQQLRPSALVLEAPFNNIFDEVVLEEIQIKRRA